MPTQHSDLVLPRPINLQHVVYVSHRLTCPKAPKLTDEGTKRRIIFHRNIKNGTTQVSRMADRFFGGGKFPPVRDDSVGKDKESKLSPEDPYRENITKHNMKQRSEPRNEQVIREGIVKRKKLFRKSESFGSNLSTIASGHTQPFRQTSLPEPLPPGKKSDLIARGFNNLTHNSPAHGYRSGNTIQGMRFASLPSQLSIASQYDIATATDSLQYNYVRPNPAVSTLPLDKKLGSISRAAKETATTSCVIEREGTSVVEDDSSGKPRAIPTKPAPKSDCISPQRLQEMQLRYKQLIQLSKQNKFTNSQVLRGERIAKHYTLPGVRQSNKDGLFQDAINKNIEILAVLSVNQATSSEKSSPCPQDHLTHRGSWDSVLDRKTIGRNHYQVSDGNVQTEANQESRKGRRKRFAREFSRKRREALKEDTERMLITKAIEQGKHKIAKPLPFASRETDSIRHELFQGVIQSPKAKVTITGENPVHKSIEITLPDCNIGCEEDKKNTRKCEDNHFPPALSDNVLNDNPMNTQSTQVKDPDNAPDMLEASLNREISMICEDTSSRGKPSPDVSGCSPRSRSGSGSTSVSRSFFVTDFLTVPVSNVTRTAEVLSVGSNGTNGGMDIPEIRMIAATPLPPSSPEC